MSKKGRGQSKLTAFFLWRTLELGIPFSDPTADGPVIQRSSARSLQNGMSLKSVMAMTRELRKETDIPIILFSYYNPILAYGPVAFYDEAMTAGADGVLVVDLPPEESNEMTGLWLGDNLSLQWPTGANSTCPIGGFKVVCAVAATFTAGTTDLDATNVTTTYFDFALGTSNKPIVV